MATQQEIDDKMDELREVYRRLDELNEDSVLLAGEIASSQGRLNAQNAEVNQLEAQARQLETELRNLL